MTGFEIHPSHLHDSANTLENFAGDLGNGGQRLQQAGESLLHHVKGDTSGVGLALAKTFGRGLEVGGGVFEQVARLSHGSSQRLHTMGTAHEHAESSVEDGFKKIHNPTDDVHNPHASRSVPSSPTHGSSSHTDAPPPNHVGFNEQTDEYHPDGTHTSGVIGGTGPSTRPHAPQLNPDNYQHLTGANSHTLTGPPVPGKHPLKTGDLGLTESSHNNSQNLLHEFDGKEGRPGKRKRPGMGSALLVGDHVVPHSSMKYDSGQIQHHGVVQQVLDNAPQDLKDRPQHGKCAEVGAISDYLHNQDPNGTWTVDQAKHHFDQVGAATTAHRPDGGEPADACPSCQYLTSQLGISWITRPIGEARTAGESTTGDD
ncbi:MAG TPA: YwqJ-related putative deaminase [Pseudonocardiaceae bacterium]